MEEETDPDGASILNREEARVSNGSWMFGVLVALAVPSFDCNRLHLIASLCVVELAALQR